MPLVAMNVPPASSTVRQCLVSTSASGNLGAGSASRADSNSSLSDRPSRIHIATAIRTALNRNGTRQPQARNASLSSTDVVSRNTRLAASTPAGTPICGAAP